MYIVYWNIILNVFCYRYKVMLATWRDDPDDRPTFTQLASIMGDFLEENVKQVKNKTKTLFFLVVTQ